jgi:hypothetical protein
MAERAKKNIFIEIGDCDLEQSALTNFIDRNVDPRILIDKKTDIYLTKYGVELLKVIRV